MESNESPSFFLDITDEVCPMTFVRTKLLLEKMPGGAIAEIRLRGREPIENVPRSAREHGHAVLALTPLDPDGPADGVHRLLIRRK